MDRCCIVGCLSRPTKRRELKFYTIPTANSSRPFKVKRRQLWLNAIEKANGDISDLSRDARICSAHFISGQLSLEMSDPDFAPSVFPNQLLRSRKGTRNERPRPNIASTPKASKVTPKKNAQRKQDKPQEPLHKSSVIVLMKNEHCKPLEDEDIHEEKDEIQQTSEAETTDRKKPVLLLKSVVGPPGWFRCDFCNDHFSNSSMLVKHIQHHDQEKSSEERLFTTSEECENGESNLPGEEIQEEEPSFKCNMCDRSFPTIHNLKRHKLLHVRDPRKCSQCGTLFCKRHNHVVVQPQISKETISEEVTATDNTMDVSNESHIITKTCKSYSVEFDNDSSDESTDPIDTTAEQLETATHSKPVPAVTCNPRKPQLLTAYMSFLSGKPKHKKSRAQPVTSTESVESTHTKSPTKDLTVAQPTPEPPTQPETSTTANTNTATTITATTQPSPLNPLISTKTNLQPALTNVFQKVEKSTVCLSFSKPLPSNVLKDFVTFISKSEGSKSMTPRLITFQAVTPPPENQKPPTDLTQPKQKLITVPITLASLPKLPPVSSDLIRTELGTNVKLELASKPSISSTFSSAMSATPDTKKINTHIKHASPQSGYVHSARPPSPVPVPFKKLRGPWETPPNYPKDFVQLHLPQTPVLPPALQMFSPQLLTSVMLNVKRNYDYILSNI